MFALLRYPILTGLWVMLLAGCAEPPPTPKARLVMVTQPGKAQPGVEAYAGEVHAREEPELSFRIGGKIARRLVDAGAHVVPGQALAELDPAEARLQSEAQSAQLAAAESDLALASAELSRYRKLADQQLVSRSLYDSRVAAQRAAQSRVRQARAQNASSGNQVGYAVLRAPQAGVIAERLAEAGQVVSAGQPVFALAADGAREVAISVPERGVSQFRLGRELMVELWSAPGKRFPAQLRELSPTADPATRTYAARVSFDSLGTTVDLGQSARVYAPASTTPAINVPLSALTQRAGRPALWIVDRRDSRLKLTAVTIGPYGENGVPVLSGINPGEWVVSAGVHLLREGEKVQPIDRNNRPVVLAESGQDRATAVTPHKAN